MLSAAHPAIAKADGRAGIVVDRALATLAAHAVPGGALADEALTI